MLLMLLNGNVSWAGETWQKKPYTEWTQKDVLSVLAESPWAKRIEHQRAEKGSRSTGSLRYELGSDAPVGMDEMKAYHLFTVVWFSALTPRQAFVRWRTLQGIRNEEEDNALLSRKAESYEIVVYGPFMSLIQDVSEESKRSVYLQTKRSKAKLLPARMQIVRQRGKDEIVEVRFHFPRDLDGQRTISPDEKEVEFHWESLNIKAVFKPREMTRDGKPDL